MGHDDENHVCMDCGAVSLCATGCAGCIRLVKYAHLGVELTCLGHQQNDLAALRRSTFYGTIVHVLVLAIVLVMAWVGVRNPIAYIGVIFGWFAFSSIAGELLVWLGRRRLNRAKAEFWELIRRENRSMHPSAYTIIDGRVLVDALREQVPEVPEERPI